MEDGGNRKEDHLTKWGLSLSKTAISEKALVMKKDIALVDPGGNHKSG